MRRSAGVTGINVSCLTLLVDLQGIVVGPSRLREQGGQLQESLRIFKLE